MGNEIQGTGFQVFDLQANGNTEGAQDIQMTELYPEPIIESAEADNPTTLPADFKQRAEATTLAQTLIDAGICTGDDLLDTSLMVDLDGNSENGIQVATYDDKYGNVYIDANNDQKIDLMIAKNEKDVLLVADRNFDGIADLIGVQLSDKAAKTSVEITKSEPAPAISDEGEAPAPSVPVQVAASTNNAPPVIQQQAPSPQTTNPILLALKRFFSGLPLREFEKAMLGLPTMPTQTAPTQTTPTQNTSIQTPNAGGGQ